MEVEIKIELEAQEKKLQQLLTAFNASQAQIAALSNEILKAQGAIELLKRLDGSGGLGR